MNKKANSVWLALEVGLQFCGLIARALQLASSTLRIDQGLGVFGFNCDSANFLSRQSGRVWLNFGVARDPLKTGGDGSDWRLHCEHGAESSFAVRNALVSLRSFGQWIGLKD